jgi:F-type H+-transporting ATPase subunit b
MYQPVLLEVASGSEHPLIDLDNTLFVQALVFAIMAFLASRWLFKPYLKMREERDEGIEGAREEAERLNAEAEAQLADYNGKLADARERASGEQRKVRAEAAAREQELIDATRSESLGAIEEAKTKLDQEVDAARNELMPKADLLARDMVSKLLGRKVA